MKTQKKFRYGLFLCLLVFTLTAAFFGTGYIYYYNSLPENIHLNTAQKQGVQFEWPLTGEIVSNNVHGKNLDGNLAQQSGSSDYMLNVKFLGIFHLKNITVNVMDKTQLIPCGIPLGIYLEMDGLLVVDTTSFKNSVGITVSPCENILQKGDYILKINDTAINSKEEFSSLLNKCEDEVILGIRRGSNYFDVKIRPEKDVLGENHLGIWIKDDAQGIGTLTYIDSEGKFGALGHGMNDTDSGELIETKLGRIYNAQILSVTKGESGAPGEFIGTIDYNPSNIIGTVSNNTPLGLYGNVSGTFLSKIQIRDLCEPLSVCFKENIKTGAAQIQTYCNGKIRRFDIEIEKVELGNTGNKGITFRVTDRELLEITNGIVQGMSGSPIIQDGKIVGAVTHVFVNDPTRGYGIFIETMLSCQRS